jgi:8-oxo-dGTP diphosphatase
MKRWLLEIARGFLRLWGLHVYGYRKPDCTATVVLLLDQGRKTLVITRKHNPFKGKQAFPGGFLEVGEETLAQAARRELQEETSLNLPLEWFVMVDERSSPKRDPRGHVVDHGFLALIPDEQAATILASLKAKDDAAGAALVEVTELFKSGMAFDHELLLRAALEKAGFHQA